MKEKKNWHTTWKNKEIKEITLQNSIFSYFELKNVLKNFFKAQDEGISANKISHIMATDCGKKKKTKKKRTKGKTMLKDVFSLFLLMQNMNL